MWPSSRNALHSAWLSSQAISTYRCVRVWGRVCVRDVCFIVLCIKYLGRSDLEIRRQFY